MGPPAHVWTPGQTVDLVEYILKDPLLASSFLNPQVVDEFRIQKQKTLCLQLLQRTEWMVWMRKEEWVVHGQKGLRGTEKWGEESPVKERLQWLQMQHIRLCTRLNNFASVRALGRDTPERRIWDEYRKKGQHAWYFTYHKLWYEYSPAAVRAREAALHPHALAASSTSAGRGGPSVEIVGMQSGTAGAVVSGVEDHDDIDDIVIISETIIVDRTEGSGRGTNARQAGSSNLGKRPNRNNQVTADRLKRTKQTTTGATTSSLPNSTSIDPIVIDIEDDGEALPGSSKVNVSKVISRQPIKLASRIGGRSVIESTSLASRIGASSTVAHAMTTPAQRVSLASRIGIPSAATVSTPDHQRVPLSSRLDQRPPTPPRRLSRSASESDSSSRPSLVAATTATPSPAIRTPPRTANDLDRLLQPRKYAREIAIAKRFPMTAPRQNGLEGDESDDDHLLNSSDIEEVPLEEDHYQGILLDQEGPTLGFGMISGKMTGSGPRLTLEGNGSEYRPMTQPLPFTIGSLQTPAMPLLVLSEDDGSEEDNVYQRPDTPPQTNVIGEAHSSGLLLSLGETNGEKGDSLARRPDTPPIGTITSIHASPLRIAMHPAEDEEEVSRLLSPILPVPPNTAHTPTFHVLEDEEMPADEDDDDVVFLGEHLGEAEDAFLNALSGVIGITT